MKNEGQPVTRVAVVKEPYEVVLFDQYGKPLLEISKKSFAQPIEVPGTVKTKMTMKRTTEKQTGQRIETTEGAITEQRAVFSDAEELTSTEGNMKSSKGPGLGVLEPTIKPEVKAETIGSGTVERDDEKTQEPDIKLSPLTPYGTRAEERIREACNESEEGVVSEAKPQGQFEEEFDKWYQEEFKKEGIEEFDKWYQEELKKEGIEKFAKQVEVIRQKKEAEALTEAARKTKDTTEKLEDKSSPKGGELIMVEKEPKANKPKKRGGWRIPVAIVGAGILVGGSILGKGLIDNHNSQNTPKQSEAAGDNDQNNTIINNYGNSDGGNSTVKPTPDTTIPSTIPDALKQVYGDKLVLGPSEVVDVSKGTVLSGDFIANDHEDYIKNENPDISASIVVYKIDLAQPVRTKGFWGGSGRTNLKSQAEIDAVIQQQAMATLGSEPGFVNVKVYDAVTGEVIKTITR